MNKSVIIASVVLSFSFAGLAESSFPFSPAGAKWTGDNGYCQFDADENWEPNASGTSDELLIQDKKTSFYLANDITIVNLKARGTHSANSLFGINLGGHVLNSTGYFKIWNQDIVVSNGTWNAASLTMGESAVPRAHLTLDNVTLNLSSSALGMGYQSGATSLTLIDSVLELGKGWDSGITASGDGALIVHNSSVAANNSGSSALIMDKRNFKVLVDGENSNFRSGYIRFKAGARDSLLSIRDGTSYYSQDSYSMVTFDNGATNNLVTIGPMKSAFFRTMLSFNAGSFGNRVVAEPGGSLSFQGMHKVAMSGQDNRLVSSNGTFTIMTFRAGLDTVSASNAVEIVGDDATFTVSRDFIVGNKDNSAPPRFEFRPGAQGFNGVAPFRSTGNNGYSKAISNMVVSVDATEYVGEKTGKFKLPLMKFSYAPQRLEVDELNAKLESEPAGGTLSYDTTDKTLYWNYRKPSGLMLIFR